MIPAPDPIPDPVPMTEDEAATVLLTIAALHGGTAYRLVNFCGTWPRWPVEIVGLCAMPRDVMPMADEMKMRPTWIWLHADERLRWAAIREFGSTIILSGRIDRGLGPHRPKRETAPGVEPP